MTENWNIPYVYGHIDLQTMLPHRKNPTIANVFSQMGIVEELGSGIQKMFKYTPLYANSKEPVIEEQDIYRIEIPYISAVSKEENGETTQKTTQKTTEKILECIKQNPFISRKELSELCGITPDGIKWQLKSMQAHGLIIRIGPDKGGHWEVIEKP